MFLGDGDGTGALHVINKCFSTELGPWFLPPSDHLSFEQSSCLLLMVLVSLENALCISVGDVLEGRLAYRSIPPEAVLSPSW